MRDATEMARMEADHPREAWTEVGEEDDAAGWEAEFPGDPFIAALVAGMRSDTLPLCGHCMASALHDEAERQSRLRGRYGEGWHGGVRFRSLQRALGTGYPHRYKTSKALTWRLIEWLQGHHFVRMKNQQAYWTNYYRPKR